MSICLFQTVHTIEQVFFPNGLPYVTRRVAKRVFDLALVKLGEDSMHKNEYSNSKTSLDKDVNDCDDSADCWPIVPLPMSSLSTVITKQSLLRVLGWGARDASGAQSRYLQQVDLRLHSIQNCTCSGLYELRTMVGEDGQDACEGDSGHPFILFPFQQG